MRNTLIGLLILAVLIASGWFYKSYLIKQKSEVLKGYIGGEKMAFLDNPRVKKILESKYSIVIDYTKAGSIEMVRDLPLEGVDFLWPSSQVSQEIFKLKGISHKSEIVFNSPIVLYTWDIIASAFEKNNLVRKEKDVYYVTDFKALVESVINGKKWSEIGVPDLYGKVTIISTDPNKSNSGMMFSGLLSTILNGDVVTLETLHTITPSMKKFFSSLGYMEHSSSDLFDQYLRTGVGAKPIIVGYESQIIEFAYEHKDVWETIKNKIVILYPLPTSWSSHPLIMLNERSKKLFEALQDKEIQRIAWEEHGFRTGVSILSSSKTTVIIQGLPESIHQVVPMPSADVMIGILDAVK